MPFILEAEHVPCSARGDDSAASLLTVLFTNQICKSFLGVANLSSLHGIWGNNALPENSGLGIF